jgi:hypothetical protein
MQPRKDLFFYRDPFYKNSWTYRDSEGARLCARILIDTYEKGIDKNADAIKFMLQDQQRANYLPAAREIIEEEIVQCRKLAAHLKEAMLSHAQASGRLGSVDISKCIKAMTTTYRIPEQYADLGNSIGVHFHELWIKLAETYIDALKTVNRNTSVLKVLDAEMVKYEDRSTIGVSYN